MTDDLATVLSAVLALAAVVLRLVPVLRHGDLGGPDAAFHVWYSDLIRSNGGALPRTDARVLGPGECTYPALFHWLLAKLPPHAVAAVGRFGGLGMDAAAGVAISGAVASVSSAPAWLHIAIVALHLIAPALTFSFIGPRAFTLTPRVFAQLFHTVAVMALIASEPMGPGAAAALWCVATVALSAAMLSAKFALQHILFTAPLAALAGFPLVLASSIAAAVLANLVSRGFFLRQVRGHLDHLVWYATLNQHFVASRGDWLALGRALRRGDLRAVASEVLVHNAIIVGIVRNLPLFLAIVIAFDRELAAGGQQALALSLAALAPWIATSIGRLRVLGEPERYLEYGWPAGWFLLWTSLPPHGQATALIGIGAFFLAFYAVNLVLIGRQRRLYAQAQRAPILAAIREAGETTVLPLDIVEMPFLLAYTRAKVVGPCCQYSLRDGGNVYFSWFFGRYPFVSATNLGEILGRWQPDHLVVTEGALAAASKEKQGGYALEGFEEVVSAGTFRLLRRRGNDGP